MTAPLLVVSGLPCAGKSTFAARLAGEREVIRADYDADPTLAGLRPSWELFWSSGRPTRLLEGVAASPRPIVMDHAYEPDSIAFDRFTRLAAAGVVLWWFDVDVRAGREACVERALRDPCACHEHAFDVMAEAADKHRDELRALYGQRWLTTLRADGSRLDHAGVCAAMFAVDALPFLDGAGR